MIRWAKTADKAAVMELWAVDFESYEPYYSWYFDTVYRTELTLCDFEGPRLAAALQLAPYTLALDGASLPICYVVGVITDPAFRRQGRGHALLRAAHDYLQREGYAAALLYTDISDYYAPLGYAHCYRQQTLCLPAEALTLAETTAKLPLHESDLLGEIPALQEIYQRMTARYDGYILRTEQNWQNYLGEQACDKARLLLAEGQAYALYVLQQNKLHIVELGFADEAALAAALAAVALQAREAAATELLWHAPTDAPHLLPYLPAAYWQARPFVMALPLKSQAKGLLAAGAKPRWLNEYT